MDQSIKNQCIETWSYRRKVNETYDFPSPPDCYTLTIMKQGQQIGSPGLHTLYEGHAIKEAL